MNAMLRRLGVLWALSLASCSPQKNAVPLRSLEASGRTSFICWGADDAPRNLEDCPDKIPYSLDHEDRQWIALVTQTTRGEVAVVNITNGVVVDEEPTVPGYNFLPIGANPVSIVSTPGSVASFVGVAEVGKEGIYGLPTSCVAPRRQDAAKTEPLRDILTWPACRLPSAPGEMAILIDPATDQGVRQSCDATVRVPADQPAGSAATRADCPADLAQETTRPGRRKLVVTLPDRGELAIMDAQAILDRTPGSFDPCPIEGYVRLQVGLPTQPIVQKRPPDFDIPGCSAPVPVPPPSASDFFPRPAGFAMDPTDQTGRLYVADREAPVVHVLDTRDACAIREEAPLLPVSYLDPSRIVTTSKVALSPPTSQDKRYLYAVDELDGGSVMIFDVSAGSTERTPIVRPRSSQMPFEAEPDRIAYDAPATDVAFAQTDRPVVDPATGNQAFASVECDPDPRSSSLGALYRPVPDSPTGAQPGILRGVFGFLALSNGQVAVVDVEDLDQKCRRPVRANAGTTENFQGCSGDDPAIKSFETSAGPTVTDERSCHIVEAHRSRSALLFENRVSTGIRSPSLLTLPKLVDVSGRTLVTDRSTDGIKNPRMLGVDFSSTDPAQVYVGTNLYQRGTPASPSPEFPLKIDPATATESSLVLNLQEPRAYARPEDFIATYEGQITGERPAGRFSVDSKGAKLQDSSIAFCNLGVEDEAVATGRAGELGVDATGAVAFSKDHADYVVIKSDILDRNDPYWQQGQGASCGGATQPAASYLQCHAQLGTRDVPLPFREFRIVKATADELRLEPRHATSTGEALQINDLVQCCFPGVVSYEVRASKEWVVSGTGSGIRHKIVTDSAGACVRDLCDPLKSRVESRAFEVSCASEASCPKDPTTGALAIGLADPGETGCVLPADYDPNIPLQAALPDPGQAPSILQRCIFKGLTAQFVIYRGQQTRPLSCACQTPVPANCTETTCLRDSDTSQLDMVFSWQVRGAFTPWTISLAVSDANASPQSIQFASFANEIVLTDGADQGLVVMNMMNLVPRSYY